MIEKRIYVVLASTLDLPSGDKREMSCGRNIAQACHAVSKLKLKLGLNWQDEHTTVVLKVADTKALLKVLDKIHASKVEYEVFRDTNWEVYGTEFSLLTAVVCYCSKKKGKSLFYGMDSWSCDV